MTEYVVRLTESTEDRGDPTIQKLTKYDAKIVFRNHEDLADFINEINDETGDGTYYEKKDAKSIDDRILAIRSGSTD